MNYNTGDKYEGKWDSDVKEGHGNSTIKILGVEEYAKGGRYDGDWASNKKTGLGRVNE